MEWVELCLIHVTLPKIEIRITWGEGQAERAIASLFLILLKATTQADVPLSG